MILVLLFPCYHKAKLCITTYMDNVRSVMEDRIATCNNNKSALGCLKTLTHSEFYAVLLESIIPVLPKSNTDV